MLAAIMFVNAAPVTARATVPQYSITKTQMEQNIQNLINLADKGYYFTISGKSNSDYTQSAVISVIKQTWLKNQLSKVPSSQSILPSGPMLVAEKDYYGYQCFGFAIFASWYIFSPNSNGDIYCEMSDKMDFTYNNVVKYAKRGDQLRIGNGVSSSDHSVIFLSANSDKKTIEVLDCNWSCGGTSKIQVHNITCNSGIYVSMRIGHISNVTVTESSTPVTSVSLNKTSASMTSGSTVSLTATVSPSNASNKSVTWSSSNSSVATVSSSGVVTAVAPGSATVTATTESGGYKATCSVTVVPRTYTIVYDANGGTGGPSSQTKTEGVGLSISTSVPTKAGYTFKGWQAPGIAGTNGWVTTKPSSGSYETGYKYYVYGYECDHCRDYGYDYDVDYTFLSGPTKANVINHVEENPDVYGSYTPDKLRYFWKIESSDKGDTYWPGQSGSDYNYFDSDYISESGIKGTASIYQTQFHYESVVYRQTSVDGPVYQPGSTYYDDANITLTAIWEATPTYTVTFDANGGTGAPTSFEAEITGEDGVGNYYSIIEIPITIPVRTGYTFVGWQEYENGIPTGACFAGESRNIWGNTDFVAVWQKNGVATPKIGAVSVTGEPGDTITIEFYIENNNGIVLSRYGSIGCDGSLNGHWDFSSLPDFSANDYSSTLSGDGKIYEMIVTINDDAKIGSYKFLKTFSDAHNADGETCIFLDIPFTITVANKSESKTYTINYDANGGTGAPAPQTKTEGGALTISDTVPTRSGYTFLGWATSSAAASATYQPGANYTANGNVTLYAVWKANEVTNEPIIEVANVSGKAGQTVEVPILLKNNPGIAVIEFKINYDKTKLSLSGYKDSGLSEWLIGVGEGENAVWISDVVNSNVSGEVLKLEFQILEETESGTATISLSNIVAANLDEKVVEFTPVSGAVRITNHIPGDINGDNTVNSLDLLRLKKYVAGMNIEIDTSTADVNSDGKVNSLDLLRLQKYIAGISVELV